MKTLICLMLAACSFAAASDDPLLEIAKSVAAVEHLQDLVDASPGGGRAYRIDNSNCFVVDLLGNSVVATSEAFVFDTREDGLYLLSHLREKAVERRFTHEPNRVIVFERSLNETEWKYSVNIPVGAL